MRSFVDPFSRLSLELDYAFAIEQETHLHAFTALQSDNLSANLS